MTLAPPRSKFDIQQSRSRVQELGLDELLGSGKIELKTETWQWEQTGNICIEYRCRGEPSGISTTEADAWVHQLRRGDGTLIWIMIPVERLRQLCRIAYKRGRYRHNAGDDGQSSVILLNIRDLLS